MSMMDNRIRVLNVPHADSCRFASNYIKTAVCELRFPTLLEIESNPPVKIQSALRKKYPHYAVEKGVSVDQSGAASSMGIRYLFESKKRDWTVSLKTNALSLESKKYIDYEDFLERFKWLLNAVGGMLDTDFFTRVGLRYINSVPMRSGEPGAWINSDLVAPLIGGDLGTLSTYHSDVAGYLEDGRYTFRHGIDPSSDPENDELLYTLDYDYFKEGVEFDDVFDVIDKFHQQNFSLFMWSLGDEAKTNLGEVINKG